MNTIQTYKRPVSLLNDTINGTTLIKENISINIVQNTPSVDKVPSEKATNIYIEDKFSSNKDYNIPDGILKQMIFPFIGSFGGSDGKRPINSVTNQPEEIFVICDGTNNTLDLRDKFICGTTTSIVTGGDNNNDNMISSDALTLDQIPSHNHAAIGNGSMAYNQGVAYYDYYHLHLFIGTGLSGSVGSGTKHTHTPPTDNRPKFYQLAFITYKG